jgi:hypothetical protein
MKGKDVRYRYDQEEPISLTLHDHLLSRGETYHEANTGFLLQNRNWRGLIIDGSSEMIATLKEDCVGWGHDITAKPAFITRENINDLISGAGFRGDLGLLSIDIDGNDYWVWEAIHVIHYIIVMIRISIFPSHKSTPQQLIFRRFNRSTSFTRKFGRGIDS